MTDTELMFAVASGESARAVIIERHSGPIMPATVIENSPPRPHFDAATAELRSQ